MFDFGEAIRRLKVGKRVARQGWNGKGMYLFLAEGTTHPVRVGAIGEVQITTSPELLPVTDTICMRTAQNTIVPGWLASQTDMLAEDWIEVETAAAA